MSKEFIVAIVVLAFIICFISMILMAIETFKVYENDKKNKKEIEEIVVNESPSAKVEEPQGVKLVQFKDNQETFNEKLVKLPKNIKKYYFDLQSKAQSYENVKCYEKKHFRDYRVGSVRIIRLLIKKGVLTAEFLLTNFEMKSLLKGNKANVKEKPIIIKIIDDEAFNLAINSMKVAYDAILKEKELKKQLRKERRTKVEV